MTVIVGHIVQDIMPWPERLNTGMKSDMYCNSKSRDTRKCNFPEVLELRQNLKILHFIDFHPIAVLFVFSYRTKYHNDVRGFNIGVISVL